MRQSKKGPHSDYIQDSLDKLTAHVKEGIQPDTLMVDSNTWNMFKKIFRDNKTGFEVGEWGLLHGQSTVEVKALMEGGMLQVAYKETNIPLNSNGQQARRNGYDWITSVHYKDLIKVPKGATLKVAKILFSKK